MFDTCSLRYPARFTYRTATATVSTSDGNQRVNVLRLLCRTIMVRLSLFFFCIVLRLDFVVLVHWCALMRLSGSPSMAYPAPSTARQKPLTHQPFPCHRSRDCGSTRNWRGAQRKSCGTCARVPWETRKYARRGRPPSAKKRTRYSTTLARPRHVLARLPSSHYSMAHRHV